MPMILQARKADYGTQAFFSFAFWPFSVKLLWAPIVDSVYFSRFGRRKSWLVPIQYLIGIFLFILSYHIQTLIGEPSANGDKEAQPEINVLALTATFVSLCFLAATQDIAVDGWALTMLKKENVGWASTCNAVGQTAGYFMGNVVFLALESPEFCNNYLRSVPQATGLVTIQGFMFFWAWVFIIATTLTAIFKSESQDYGDDEPEGVIAFSATDSVAGLKLIDSGMPKERLAMLGVPMIPIQIVLPLIISKYTGGNQPLAVFMKAYPARLLMGIVIAYVVWVTPSFKSGESEFPISYYIMLLIVYALHQVTLYSIYVSQMAFTAKISDPSVGGTYMTLLNTITNLGGNWPATIALYLVSHLDIKTTVGETTIKTLDGFYIETMVCTIVGVLWYIAFKPRVRAMQRLEPSAWKV
ncbi:SLC33A1 [Bugula neritina]|uniref:SLC33A1 n=1 Tax=Bugula neritina TaxID=10212 RepID=A0A7J7K5V5_BUGNE|nr:SLC33A1 [Bugula neritina]